MATFGELKKDILRRAAVSNHFDLIRINDEHRQLWEDMNSAEYDQGYDHEEYMKPGSTQLQDMELLDQAEYDRWIARYERIAA